MLARWARIIGDRLAMALELPQEAAERAAYALELIFLEALTLGAIVVAAWLTGLLWPALVATFTAALMRSVSGGAHSDSPWRCLILSTFLALLCGLVGRALAPFLTRGLLAVTAGAVALPGAVILYRRAPADTPAKPIRPRQGAVLKRLSLVLLALWVVGLFLLPASRDLLGASIVAMTWQIFTVTQAGYWFSRRLDGLWQERGGEQSA